ncbi:MAG: FtsX-like permease family protein [Gemmatimonadetes bacterium]|nr:FtsX-like permease family protein [Gemmatimonadota bacterium]
MRPRFVLSLARWEGRSALRRVGVYMGSITLGVAALVAIHGFRDDVARSVREEARSLMGADVRLAARRPLPDSVARVVDSLTAAGHPSARVTTVITMVMAPRTGDVRLLQVRGAGGGWPFYGDVATEPAGAWRTALAAGEALVDPAALIQLGIAPGDSLAVGTVRIRIAGTVSGLPTDLGFQTAVGPRVFVSPEVVEAAGLLGFGSLARHETFVRLPDAAEREEVEARYRDVMRATDVDFDTADEQARSLTRATDHLGRYLGLVGLGALLLGGIGVASAIHVYVMDRRDSIAVLRCVGASQGSLFLAYLLQAAVLGTAGAAVGVVLGVGVQQLLPVILSDVLPVAVTPRPSPLAMAAGLGIGAWVAVLFALEPLLGVRDVPPLRALRQDVEPTRRRLDPARWATWAALGGSVALLCVMEAPEVDEGLVFAGALAVVMAVLGGTGALLVAVTRRALPSRARYAVRQGVANLFRPRNQTVAVTLAMGFGVFVVGTVTQVQASLSSELTLDAGQERPNLVFFDVQPDQVDGVVDLLPPGSRPEASVIPIVPSRIASINGRSPEELRADSAGPRPARWALRREYRNTYRDSLNASETLVAGRWWDESADPAGPAPISVEGGLADDLGLAVGDRVTWDVGGRLVESEVASLRLVDWARFEPNFFVVFAAGTLEDVPRTFVILARVSDVAERAGVQRSLVAAFSNVSVLDVARVQEAVETILDRVDAAVRFLGVFSVVAGLLVLAGSLATSRSQRLREAALLRTLGARRGQIVTVLVTEYLVLATLASVTGLALATAAAWAMARGFFEIPFRPALGPVVLVWLGMAALTVAVGLFSSRGLLSRPPLPVLREAGE